MAKPRVHEVAKELGLTSKEVLAHLEKIGRPAKSHSSTIEESLAARVRSELSDGGGGQGTKAEPAPARVEEPAAPAEPAPAAQAPAAPAAGEAPAQEAPAQEAPAQEAGPLRVHRGITVKEFAEKVGRPPNEIVKILFGLGEMVTVNQSMSDEAVELVGEEIGVPVTVVDPAEQEAELEAAAGVEEAGAELVVRPPVVTVMGHVDHGKTTILDAIRKTDVASREAGGITQHIGAYQVHFQGRPITFIDTPGHEAFTAMRARGAHVTDIVVLVVAADDGVMPQTVEAIDHARAAGVPIIVAVNKIDKPDADPARVRQELTQYELVPEEWGGTTPFVDVSAKQRKNLDSLLEMILLTADVELDLKTTADALARGVVIEAHLDRGRGPVATVLVKRGTLRKGDAVLAGIAWGRVRAMLDDYGNEVSEAPPGMPVQVLGWHSLPDAGDEFRAFEDEREAKALAAEREQHRRAAERVARKPASLAALLAQTKEGETPELNLLIKADTQGSVEALEGQLAKLDESEVRVNVLRKGVGAITENDVMLAQASQAIVIGFNVVPTAQARARAEAEGVDIRTYRVIYQAVEDIQRAATGLLGPQVVEQVIGQAEVRALFRVPRVGTVAGCMVTNGVVRRNAKARVVRDGAIVYESTIGSLKRFKDDVREVAAGYECGLTIEGFNDVKEGDVIEVVEVREVER